MKKLEKKKLAGLVLAALLALPSGARAQGAAPEMFGVREIILQYARFTDPKTSDTCGLSRDQLEATLLNVFNGTGTPVQTASMAKPPVLGVARIDLIPEITTHADENLDCVSWVSLTAQNKLNAVIPPITTLRTVTVLYWQQRLLVSTSQSTHSQHISETLKKMAEQFAQQYKLDQPPEVQQQMSIPKAQPVQQQIPGTSTAPSQPTKQLYFQ